MFFYTYLTPSVSFSRDATSTDPTPETPASAEQKQIAKHIPTPENVKAIYMSQCVVGTPTFRDSLVKMIDDTELNELMASVNQHELE